MNDVLRDPNTVQKILFEHIIKYVDHIPSKGVLAGGAVANVLCGMVWGVDLPINDVDIFQVQKSGKSKLPGRNKHYHQYEDPYKGLVQTIDVKNAYTVIGTSRTGNFNYVNIRLLDPLNTNFDYINVLKGFDLNCCQVGINLETRQLIYTPEFEKFLFGRQLKVVTLYTPFHTAIRVFKKMEELKCFCDVEREMRYLTHAVYSIEDPWAKPSGYISMFFGEKSKEVYEKYADKLSPYFELVDFVTAKCNSYLKHNFSYFNVPLWYTPTINDVPKDRIAEWIPYNGKIWSCIPTSRIKIDDKLVHTIKSEHFRNLNKIKTVWDLHYGGHNKASIEKGKTILNSNYIYVKNLFYAIKDFFKCDFDDKVLKRINTFLEKHLYLTNFFVKGGFNVQKCNEIIMDLNRIADKYGEGAVVALEKIMSRLEPTLDFSYEKLDLMLLEEKKILSQRLKEPLNISDYSFREMVKEIVDDWSLIMYANTFNNCLYNPGQNFSGRIKNGECLVFVLEYNHALSVVELKLDRVYTLVQHRIVNNQEPSVDHKHLRDNFISYLNMKYCSSEIISMIEKIDEQKKSSFDDLEMDELPF